MDEFQRQRNIPERRPDGRYFHNSDGTYYVKVSEEFIRCYNGVTTAFANRLDKGSE